jgi:hypothetical protein
MSKATLLEMDVKGFTTSHSKKPCVELKLCFCYNVHKFTPMGTNKMLKQLIKLIYNLRLEGINPCYRVRNMINETHINQAHSPSYENSCPTLQIVLLSIDEGHHMPKNAT